MLKLTFALLLIATVLHSATAAPPYSRETPVEIRSEADRLLAAEWKRNRLEVPAGASDSVMVRRLYLDLAGRVPTPEEAKQAEADVKKMEELYEEEKR